MLQCITTQALTAEPQKLYHFLIRGKKPPQKKRSSAMAIPLRELVKLYLPVSRLLGFYVHAFSHLNNLDICHVPYLHVV